MKLKLHQNYVNLLQLESERVGSENILSIMCNSVSIVLAALMEEMKHTVVSGSYEHREANNHIQKIAHAIESCETLSDTLGLDKVRSIYAITNINKEFNALTKIIGVGNVEGVPESINQLLKQWGIDL